VPEGALIVQIPLIDQLDPVGLAMYLKKEYGYYLTMYDFQENSVAKVLPSSKSIIEEFFRSRDSFDLMPRGPKR